MIEYKFDTQLLIEGTGLDEDAIYDYFVEHFKGDCLLVVGDEDLIKIHYHTNEPWLVLEYCASLGEIHDIVLENMQLQRLTICRSQSLSQQWLLIRVKTIVKLIC